MSLSVTTHTPNPTLYLANNLSKREIGNGSALDDVEFDPDETAIGSYEKLNWNGRTVRSIVL